ncbi:MAG TPA: hypothetical protein VK504_32605 [Vicinamibacterales bacterium]|nr:hypothetical protein [Vicinamibacterales bacterium]
MVVLRACGRMLPRLEAEESILAADRLGVGTRTVSRQAVKEALDRWQRTAHPAHTRARARRPRATPDSLAALGIGYHIVEPETPTGEATT